MHSHERQLLNIENTTYNSLAQATLALENEGQNPLKEWKTKWGFRLVSAGILEYSSAGPVGQKISLGKYLQKGKVGR